ncbi:MAG: class I SAM-dependent methyltransferase [Patescibacteria group bacterium]
MNLDDENKDQSHERQIDWSGILDQYEVPTVFKDELLRPYFEQGDFVEPILDVGCGRGYFSNLLLKRGYRVFGIDLNSDLQSSENFDFQKRDFITFETDQKFNTILLVNVLTTAPPADRLKILKKIKEIKSESGVAYVVNTNADLFGNELDSETLTIRKGERDTYRLKVKLVNGECIEFDDYVIVPEEMEEMCKEVGLEIVERKDLKSQHQDKPIYQVYVLR